MGKLQTFHDEEYGLRATLKVITSGFGDFPYLLQVRDHYGRLIYRGQFSSARLAKQFLEEFDGRWFTLRGYVE